MAPLKALSALIGLFAIRPSTALPRCMADQYQADPLVFRCGGSGGQLEQNTIETNIPAHGTRLITMIPKGVASFQVLLRGSSDADLIMRYQTGENFFSGLRGGSNPTASMTREGMAHGMQFKVTQTAGSPTVETVKISGLTTRPMSLIVKNNQAYKATVRLGYFYSAWSNGANGQCPWHPRPLGCEDYNNHHMQQAARAMSTWLSTAFSNCEEAWSEVGVPQAKGGGVPFYNWHNVLRQWPGKDSLGLTEKNLAGAMFKFASDGGLEAEKLIVRRSDFLWVCGLNQLHTQFIQPCCGKISSAFTDENDAWSKLGDLARQNGHSHPMQAVWEVCRGLLNAPTDGRNTLLRYFDSDTKHIEGPHDLKVCYPNGPVQVQPTTEPLISQASVVVSGTSRPSSGGINPWEDDGSHTTPDPYRHWDGHTDSTPTPTDQGVTQEPATNAPTPEVPTTTAGNAGTTDPIYGTTAPGGTTATPGGTTVPPEDTTSAQPTRPPGDYPTITDPPPTTHDPHAIDIAGQTTEKPTGQTMAPQINPETGESVTHPPTWQGIAAAVGVGTVVAGAAIGGAYGIHHAVTHGDVEEGGTTMHPLGEVYGLDGQQYPEISARREGVDSQGSTVSARQTGTEGTEHTGTAVFPALLLLGVFCGFLLCAGIAGGLFYCISRRRQKFDRDVYMPPQGFFPPNEDEEQLLHQGYPPSFHGMSPGFPGAPSFDGYPPGGFPGNPQQAMGMIQ